MSQIKKPKQGNLQRWVNYLSRQQKFEGKFAQKNTKKGSKALLLSNSESQSTYSFLQTELSPSRGMNKGSFTKFTHAWKSA